MENWKDIPGYEGIYQVSDLGRVKSLQRYSVGKNNSVRVLDEKLLKLVPTVKDYIQVKLFKDGKHRWYRVHQLVMLAFVGPMPVSCQLVMHLDDVRNNNKLSNLRYGTQKENVRDAINKNRFCLPKGRPARKVVAINLLNGEEKKYDSIADARRALNVSKSSVRSICYGIFNRVGNYTFKFQ